MRKLDTALSLITVALVGMPWWSTARGEGLADRSAVLNVDGIVKVKGLPLEGARMKMMERDGELEVMDKGLAHFARELPLQTAILMVFEREGCVTKQLYFDTHVPSEAVDLAPFSFPFQVTLEALPDGQQFEYAGPVGYIRYYPERQDFGYDTDYSRKADPILAQRMELATTNLVTSSPSATPTTAPAVALSKPEPEVEDTSAFHVLVPTRSSHGTLVHPTGNSSINNAAGPLPASPVVDRPAPPPAPKPVVTEIRKETPPAPSAIAEDQPREQWEAPPPSPGATGRNEELIVEKNRVTTIVRITNDGHVDEYRRVSHYFGAVYYFKNGQSCTDLVYEQGTE
jgi:hypothetical protein